MAGEAPKNQQAAAAAADAVESTKAFAESAKTAVIKQSEQVKEKIVGAADDTKTTSATDQQGVGIKDKVVGAADDTKTSATEQGVIVKDRVVGAADDIKTKVVGGADDTKTTSATEQGVGVKDKVFGAVGSAFEATKTGVAQGVDKAQSYFNPTPTTTTTTTDAPVKDNKE